MIKKKQIFTKYCLCILACIQLSNTLAKSHSREQLLKKYHQKNKSQNRKRGTGVQRVRKETHKRESPKDRIFAPRCQKETTETHTQKNELQDNPKKTDTKKLFFEKAIGVFDHFITRSLHSSPYAPALSSLSTWAKESFFQKTEH